MVGNMRKCHKCDIYTLNREKCPNCGEKTHVPHPAKFSPDDKYAVQKGMMRHSRK